MMVEWAKRWLRWEEAQPPQGLVARLLRRYLLWNNDWYGSHAIRYLPIASLLRRLPQNRPLPVLEVGSADRGLAPFLRRKVVAVDLHFNRENLARAVGLPLPVLGRVEQLPFRDAAFEAVVAVDLFEHLPRSLRGPAAREMARVAKHCMIIAVPCGKRAAEAEERLDQYHQRRFGISNRWLVEHRKYELPETEEMMQLLRAISPRAKLTNLGNAPLPFWYGLEALEIAVPRNYFRRVLTGWIVRLISMWNAKNPYRRIFMLELLAKTSQASMGLPLAHAMPGAVRWERLLQYPERSFVRHRAETAGPLSFARMSPHPDRSANVSIVIPTLDADRGGYLPRLLQQLEQQTYKEWELLLVLGDRRQGRAINAAAALAKGSLLLTLDDDTELGCPDSIGRLVAAIDSDRTIGLAGGINGIPKDAAAFVKRVMHEVPRRSTPAITQITDSDLAEHPLLLINKEVFFQVGGENEMIPRGLDPYLREAFRKAGYRVVVVPGAEYSHLPPSNFTLLMKQFYRNGKAAAFVNRHYPQWAIETPSMHGPFRLHVAFPSRVVRFLFRQGYALLTGKLIWFLCEVVYAMGFLHEWLFPTEQR